jgi:hypothetical protein
MGAHWLSYSLLFLLFLGVFAWILPTRYTLGFLSILQYAVGLFMYALVSLWSLGLLLFASILSMLGFGNLERPDAESEPVIPELPPIVPGETTPVPWLEALKSIVFWIVFLGLIVFAVHQYISQNPALVGKLRMLRFVSWLERVWRWLRSWFVGVNQVVSMAIRSGIRRFSWPDRLREPGGWSYVNLRRLSPRQKVVFYYLALIRRGGERGFARRPVQTAYEYQETLQSALEGGEEDLSGLTEAFVEARYSQHSVTTDQVSRVKRWWEEIRKRLRR